MNQTIHIAKLIDSFVSTIKSSNTYEPYVYLSKHLINRTYTYEFEKKIIYFFGLFFRFWISNYMYHLFVVGYNLKYTLCSYFCSLNIIHIFSNDN